jgi:hypothetical protein
MKNLPTLSAAEQALMDLIWKHQPVTVSALLDLVNQPPFPCPPARLSGSFRGLTQKANS